MRQMRCKWNYFRGADPRSHRRMGSFTSPLVRYPVMVCTSTLGVLYAGDMLFVLFPNDFRLIFEKRNSKNISGWGKLKDELFNEHQWLRKVKRRTLQWAQRSSLPSWFFSFTSSLLLMAFFTVVSMRLSTPAWIISSLFALIRQSRAKTKLCILGDAGKGSTYRTIWQWLLSPHFPNNSSPPLYN